MNSCCGTYTPMALKFTHRLLPSAIIYDCMDELSAFAGAPPELTDLERELFRQADVVFTGGHTLFQAKRAAHQNVHPFPSSVDVPHFARARSVIVDPADQAAIPRPRLGYFGVIDERIDYALLRAIAAARPDWQLVLVGPTAKVNPADLPTGPNLHYLGPSRTPICPTTSRAGTWPCCRSPATRRPDTSARRKHPVPRRREAGRLDAHHRRRDPIRRPRPGPDCRFAGCVHRCGRGCAD